MSFDTCNGSVVTHTDLTFFFSTPVKICAAISTGPAPVAPAGPPGPGLKKEVRDLPTVVGQSVEFAKTNLGSVIDVSINGGTGFQMSKLYTVAYRYDTSDPNGWYEVRPLNAPQPYGTGHDFALDVKRNGSEQTYRVRRTFGTTPATASIDIYTQGTYTTSTSTGATAAVGYAPNTVITQTGDKVAVGKLSTDAPVMLLDLGSAGLGSTSNGITLNCDTGNVGTQLVRWRRSGSTRFDLTYLGSTDRLAVSDGGSTTYTFWDRATGTCSFVTAATFGAATTFASGSTATFASGSTATFASGSTATFQSGGTATFASGSTATFGNTPAFTNSFTLESAGGANPVKFSQNSPTSTFGGVLLQPTVGNAFCSLALVPSGTAGRSQFQLINASDSGNSGSLRLMANGATGYMESVTVGSGSAVTLFRWESGVDVMFLGKVGFYGSPPLNRPTCTGSRGGNAAIASVLAALASLGLIIDSTTA